MLKLWVFQPVVKNFACYAQLFGYLWQIVPSEPSSTCQFATLQMNVPTDVVCIKTNHKAAGEWPWLRAEIA